MHPGTLLRIAVLSVLGGLLVLTLASCAGPSARPSELPPVPDGYGFEGIPSDLGTCYQGSKPSDPSASVAEVADFYRTKLPPLGWESSIFSPRARHVVTAFVPYSSLSACGQTQRYLVAHATAVWTREWGLHGSMFETLTVAAWVMNDDDRLYLWLGRAHELP
jgi:hypothetical protein